MNNRMRGFRVIALTVFALSIATAAHAQGTMDFSGAQTLMGTFKTPALYEIKDGKGSLINYDFANGLFTIPKIVDQGYLSIGKQRVDFRQTKAGS